MRNKGAARNKGVAAFVVFFFVMLLVLIISYPLFSSINAGIFPEMRQHINETEWETGETNALANIMENVWQYFPYFIIFMLIVLLIAASQKREPQYQVVG